MNLGAGHARGRDSERLEVAQDAAAKDVRGLRCDVGRLADSDIQLTARADKAHERLHQQRIDDIADRLVGSSR